MLDLGGYGPSLLEGVVLTIEAALLSLIVAVALGALGALGQDVAIAAWPRAWPASTPR